MSTFAPQTVTLTNTGGVALTWTAHNNSIYVDVSPTTGTLTPGAHVDLTVVGQGAPVPTNPYNYQANDVTVTTNVPGDVAHTLSVTNTSDGYVVTPPATVAFGPVPVGTTVSKTVPVSWFVPSPFLSSNAPIGSAFALSGNVPTNNGGAPYWTLYFSPLSSGEQSTTLTISDFQGCVFPPNTFLATGTGT